MINQATAGMGSARSRTALIVSPAAPTTLRTWKRNWNEWESHGIFQMIGKVMEYFKWLRKCSNILNEWESDGIFEEFNWESAKSLLFAALSETFFVVWSIEPLWFWNQFLVFVSLAALFCGTQEDPQISSSLASEKISPHFCLETLNLGSISCSCFSWFSSSFDLVTFAAAETAFPALKLAFAYCGWLHWRYILHHQLFSPSRSQSWAQTVSTVPPPPLRCALPSPLRVEDQN